MKPKYRADIDGLRSIAIASVVLYHAGFAWLKGGYVGVDVFFVISGYLIGSHVYRDVQANRFSFLSFYNRRAKRILPAFLAVTALTLICGALLLAPSEFRRLGQQGIAAVASSSNIYFWKNTNYFQPASDTQPLLMTWSLGVEEQFYLFFPWIIVGFQRFRRELHVPALAALTLAFFILALVGMHRDIGAAFYLLPYRAWELGVGCLLGISEISIGEDRWERLITRLSNSMAALGLILVLAPMFFYWKQISFPGWTAVPPVLGTALLIAYRKSLLNQRLLSAAPLVWLGRVSYSWYLWHWPLMSFLRVTAPQGWTTSLGFAAATVSLLIGVLSYYAIETPFRKSHTAGGWVLVRYGIASAAVAALCAAPLFTHGLPSRYPHAAEVEVAMHERLPDPCIVSYGETNFSSQAECLPPTDGQPTLVLLGDSHGSALAPHLRDATVAHGWHFAELTKSSCPPLEGTTRYMHLHPDHARECMEFNRSALAWVLAHTQVKAVVLAGYWLGPFEDSPTVDAYVSNIQNVSRPGETESLANFRGGLNREIGILMQSGKEVLLVQDVPHLSFDPALMELTRAIPLRRKLANLVTPHSLMQQDAVARIDAVSQTEISFAEIVRSVAKENRTDVLETPEAFCNELSCSYGRDGYSFYFDPQHLSALGSQVALKDLPPGLFDGERKPTESDLRSRASAPIH